MLPMKSFKSAEAIPGPSRFQMGSSLRGLRISPVHYRHGPGCSCTRNEPSSAPLVGFVSSKGIISCLTRLRTWRFSIRLPI